MPRNLWLGLPGRLREISQAATAFERGADLGISQFTSLGGQITTIAPRRAPRRIKLTFDRLSPEDAAHLDRLARRVDGPEPVDLIDPVGRNLLDPLQAAGRGATNSAAGFWYTSVTGAGRLEPSTAPEAAPHTYLWKPEQTTAQLNWHRRPRAGFPVSPGMRVRFTLPPSWRTGPCTTRLHWRDAAGTYLSSAADTGHTLLATAPAGAALVTPSGIAGEIGTYALDGAVLTIDDDQVPAAPANLLPADQAAGKGPLTQWSATGLTLSTDASGFAVASLAATTAGTLTFVNGTAKGHPLPAGPGQVGLVLPTAVRTRASGCQLTFFDAAGATLGTVSGWSPAAVPAGAAQVSATVSFASAAAAFQSRIGPARLLHTDPTAPQPPGDGCPVMSVVSYTDTPARPLPYRNISIELAEVTHASG
ncbi:hypothetical protein [Streptomyces lichenis]|uniref:Uncharacterized protein n=1 Tax=Streptomyces lichenis TaxID=2306967 RepID=A0ABT0IG60_9ACTN|nr:hypothetical protein [Streptomyces lichenis]MCK8680316.1 hypothetical protein [Streptomyces lichenis]